MPFNVTFTNRPQYIGQQTTDDNREFCVYQNDSERLNWVGKANLPNIGDLVKITMNGIGDGIVTGYFSAETYLGIVVRCINSPEWHRKNHNGAKYPLAHVFGTEIAE